MAVEKGRSRRTSWADLAQRRVEIGRQGKLVKCCYLASDSVSTNPFFKNVFIWLRQVLQHFIASQRMSLGMWDLSSKTRHRTCIPLFSRWILNHWTPGKSHKRDSCRACCLEVGLWTKCSEGSLRTLMSLAKRALDVSLSLAEWPQMDSSPVWGLAFPIRKMCL